MNYVKGGEFKMAKTEKNNNSLKTLKETVVQKEFWVGLATTVIVLLVAFKLIPWNKVSKFTTNKTPNIVSPVPTSVMVASKTASNEGMMQTSITPAATTSAVMAGNSALKKKVATLADTTGGSYTVVSGDNYYTISLKVCGTGKFFESIQEQNNGVALYAGDEITVNCTF